MLTTKTIPTPRLHNYIFMFQAKYEEAGKLYELSQVKREEILGPDHPKVALSLNNRAQFLLDQASPLIYILSPKSL